MSPVPLTWSQFHKGNVLLILYKYIDTHSPSPVGAEDCFCISRVNPKNICLWQVQHLLAVFLAGADGKIHPTGLCSITVNIVACYVDVGPVSAPTTSGKSRNEPSWNIRSASNRPSALKQAYRHAKLRNTFLKGDHKNLIRSNLRILHPLLLPSTNCSTHHSNKTRRGWSSVRHRGHWTQCW